MWERGAEGEAATASALKALGPSWSVFHDVRWPGRPRANIDHVVVGPTGVFVIDSKNWSGDVRVVGDVLHQGSRRREREVAAAADAALAVTQLLQGLGATPVMCFVRPDPIEGQARGVMICSTQNLVQTLATQPPVLGPESIRRVSTILRQQLASATDRIPQHPRGGHAASKRMREQAAPRTRSGVRLVKRLSALALAILVALVGLGLVIALVGSVVDAVHETARGGAGAQHTSAPLVGDVVKLPQTSSHPALEVQADKVMRVAARPGYPLQPGQHLIAVRYSIRNRGADIWAATSPYLQFAALASNGQHVPSASYSDLPARKLMPAAFNLSPGKARAGFVVYVVPDGAKLVRVSIQAYLGSRDGVEWLIP
jgi:hypothetical protein